MKYGKLNRGKLIYFKPYRGGLELDGYIIYNPTAEQYIKGGWFPVVEVLEDGKDKVKDNVLYHYVGLEVALKQAIEAKIKAIEEYDVSENVNSFILDDMRMWIPRETRVSLQNSTAILIKNGIEKTTLWYNTLHYELSCDSLLSLLDALEIYALQCFNTTAEHKANVMQMTSIEDVEAYDFATGYPKKLNFIL